MRDLLGDILANGSTIRVDLFPVRHHMGIDGVTGEDLDRSARSTCALRVGTVYAMITIPALNLLQVEVWRLIAAL